MTAGRLTRALATASLAGVAVLGMSATALAQPYGGPGRVDSPPGQDANAACPADPARPGQPGLCGRGAEARASSGANSLDPGTQGRFGIEQGNRQLGTFARNMDVTDAGAAEVTFTVPPFLADGVYTLVFFGQKNGQDVVVRVPFTVSGGSGVTQSGFTPSGFISAGAPGSTAVGSTAPGAAVAPSGAAAAAAPSATTAGTSAASVGVSADGTVASGSALPRTGSSALVEMTAAGIALVALGGGVVVASRRRRDEVGTSIA